MRVLLNLAEFFCGRERRGQVFEPLVADWQREWSGSPHSALARIRIAASGSTALAIAVVTCLLTVGVPMPRTAVMKGLLTLVISSFALLTLQIVLVAQQASPQFGIEPRIWMAFSRLLPLMIPLAILPMMMLWHGLGLSHRTAIAATIVMSLLTVVVVGWLVPKTQGDIPIAALSDRWQEQMHQRVLENDRAARYTYPGSAVRALRPSTAEQRAAARRKWRSNPVYIAARAEQMRPRWNARTFMMGALTIVLATLGWALGRLGRTRPIHAAAWWTLTCVALMFFGGQFTYWINTAAMRAVRAAAWVPLAIFATAAVILLLGSRRHQTRTPDAQISSEVNR